MKARLSKGELAFIIDYVVEPLAKHGYTVSCFGSRARGEGTHFSDVDLLIEGPGEPRALVSELSERLIDSGFPYKIDLVIEADLAESYRTSVMAERIALHADGHHGKPATQ